MDEKDTAYCGPCGGSGEGHVEWLRCSYCNGTGEVADPPDDDALLTHLESQEEERINRAEWLEAHR